MTDRPGRSFSVGSIRCTALLDGEALYEPQDLFSNASPDEWKPLVSDRLDPNGYLPVPYQPLLIEGAETTVLIDAGAGAELAAEWEEPVGLATASLASLGITPEAIQIVLITHAHPDHVGGLTTVTEGARQPVFPNARHLISSEEWRFWHLEVLPEPSSHMAPVARIHLTTLREAGLLELIDGDVELAAGVRTMTTPGHTPGHLSVSVSSEGENAVVAGDAILTDASFGHPEWYAGAEVDPAQTAATRASLLDRTVRENAVVTAFHVHGIGRVRPRDGTFALEQISLD
jgi:glyoxylase-like metal-dependent hydrolase (beta-lactamase superfamily II)